MKRTVAHLIAYMIALSGVSRALAVPVILNDAALQPPLEVTAEQLPVSALPRLGVRVQLSTLDASRVRLSRGDTRLEYSAASGWLDALGHSVELPAPTQSAGVLQIQLACLEALGFALEPGADGVKLESHTPLPEGGLNQISQWSAHRKPDLVTLEFLRAPIWTTLEKTPNRIVIQFKDTTGREGLMPVGGDGLSRARLWQSGADAMLELEFTARAVPSISQTGTSFSLNAAESSLMPPQPGPIPDGVNYTLSSLGTTKLHLVRLNPERFQPKVLTAPWGGALNLLEQANRIGAVAAVNGGYFDPSSLQAVDYLVANGQTWAYWRGTRAGVGFSARGLLWGAPRSRLMLEWQGQKFTVNNVQAGANPKYLTAFVGDGFASVGGLGYTTLVLANGVVSASHDESYTPQPGELSLSFDPLTFPALKAQPGDALSLAVNSSDPAWLEVNDAITAGPQLVKNGAYAVNPVLEGFDTSKEIWRATRQVGFGIDANGWYVIAMLELGTPEDFARALVAAGLRDALRFDSGSSAQVFMSGGLIGGRWARTIPNALAFVPRLR